MIRKQTLMTLVLFILLASLAYAIQITPIDPLDTDDLACSHGNDPSAYLYYWYNGATELGTGQTLSSSLTSRGDVITCKAYIPATPWSGPVLVDEEQVTIQNQAPVLNPLPNQNINEDGGFSGNLFDLDNYASDGDGDPLTFNIIDQTNASLINCVIDVSNFIDCLAPAVNQFGLSNVTVEVSDSFETANSTFTVNVTPVNDAPTAPTLIAPANETITNNPTPTFNWSASTDVENDPITYTLNITGVGISVYYTSDLNQTLTTPLLDGDWVWKVIAYDGINNSAWSEEWEFTVDTSVPDINAPVINVFAVPDTTYVPGGIDYTFTANVTDDVAVDTVIFEFNGTNQTVAPTAVPDIYNVSITNLPAGTYNYRWHANDTSGNTTSSAPFVSFTINKAASVVELLFNGSHQNITVVVGEDINVTGTLLVGEGDISLYVDGVIDPMSPEPSPIQRITSYASPIVSNLTLVYDATQNYTSSNDTLVVIVLSAPDTTPPVISNVQNSSITNESAVITWTTDELSNSSVNYGLTPSLGTLSEIDDSVTSHSISLAGLNANITYYYNVTSCDASGNCAADGPYSFDTLETPDTAPPVISNIQAVNITNESVVITWDTDELSNSTVNYGLTPSLGTLSEIDDSVTSHSISLAGLNVNITYYYNVTSCDAAGNCATDGAYSFTTLENIQLAKIVINEFEQNPAAGSEWVELYNPNAFQVNISGWEIWEGLASPGVLHTVPAATLINADSYYVANVINLNNGGEYITLYDYNSFLIDNSSTLAEASASDSCQARVPNGIDTDTGADWTFQRCTQGITNDDNVNPTVINVQANPIIANQSDVITISANVSDYFGILSVDAYITWDATSATIGLTDGDSDGVYDGTFSQTTFTGTYTVTIIATDVNANVNNSETTTFDITVIPGAGNSSTLITGPASDSVYNFQGAFTVYANITASNGDLTNCNAMIGFTNGAVLSTANTTNALGNLLNGTSVITSWDVDAIGVGSSDITVTTLCFPGSSSSNTITNITVVDAAAPTVTLELPVSGSTDTDGNVTIQYSVIDDVAVNLNCDIYSNTSGTWQIDYNDVVANGSSSTYDYTNLPNGGDYRWNVECSDGISSAFAAADYTFTVNIPDVTQPVVTLVSPANGNTDTDGNVTIVYQVSDDMAATLTCNIYSNRTGTWQVDATQNNVPNGGLSSYDYIALPDGGYVWNVECSDGSNSDFAAANWAFVVDTTVPDTIAPVVTLISPPHGSTDTDGDVTVQYNVIDDVATSLTCNVYSDTSGSWQIDTTQVVANGSSGSHSYAGVSNGNYNWNVQCDDGSNSQFAPANYVFSVDVPGILDGYALDELSAGIAGATVEVKQGASVIDSTTTLGDGSYSFTLDEGTYTVLVYASGYVDNETTGVVVSAGSTTVHNAVLQTIVTTGNLSGTVSDANNNIYLATVDLYQGASLIDSTMTDENGTYSFNSLTVGNYNITVWKSGFNDDTAIDFAVNVGSNTHDVTLTQAAFAGSIAGTILDGTDGVTTISGATVYITRSDTLQIVQIVTSDISGDYIINGLPPTVGFTYDLNATATGYTQAIPPTGISLTSGESKTGQDIYLI